MTPGIGGQPSVRTATFPATARRLSALELQTAVKDALSFPGALNVSFPDDRHARGFDTQYDRLTLSQAFGDALQTLAEDAGSHVVATLPKLMPCDVAAKTEAVCLDEFLGTLAANLYRRPLKDDEKLRQKALFTRARGEIDFAPAIGVLIEAIIQSPQFFFRTELGDQIGPRPKMTLTPFETAAQMSFFLLGSGPDSDLKRAAALGTLATGAVRREQAERLLKTPKGQSVMRDFMIEWLGLEDFLKLTKDDVTFTPTLAASMFEETKRFLDDVLWQQDGKVGTLFSSNNTFVDKGLAAIYGVPAPTAWQRTMLDNTKRRGLLTQATVLTTYSHGKTTRSPVPFGNFLLKRVLCKTMPDPPPGVAELTPPSNLKTTRDISVVFRQNNPQCQSCHRPIDGPGLPIAESYDSLGRASIENPADPQSGKGALYGTDVDGDFTGAVGLSERLVRSADLRECFAAQLMSRTSGRDVTDSGIRSQKEGESLKAVTAGFASGAIVNLVLDWVASDDFVTRDGALLP